MATLSRAPVESRESGEISTLWKGAGLTAFAALFFPRLNAVLHDDQKLWQLDDEAKVLAPLVVVISLVVFAAIGPVAWRGVRNRPALVSLLCGVLGVLGIVAFWMSVPIMFGGLAVTLGLEGLRRSPYLGRRGLAVTGTVLGVVGVLAGAGLWLTGA